VGNVRSSWGKIKLEIGVALYNINEITPGQLCETTETEPYSVIKIL
jgi:hypothetical protein